MDHRRRVETDAKVLPDSAAERLLARASELDAARVASAQVAELRAAAVEAGISTSAFDAALAELQAAEQAPVPDVSGHRRRRSQRRALVGAVAVLIAAGAVGLTQMRALADVAAAVVEEALLLRCLSSGEAAELIRPLLDGTSTVVHSPSRAPRVLTVRGTPAQIEKVRSALDQYERAGSPACANPVPN